MSPPKAPGAPYKREIEALRRVIGDDVLCALIRIQEPASGGLSKNLTLPQRERFLDTVCADYEARVLADVPALHPYLRRRQREGHPLPLTAARWPDRTPTVVPSDRTPEPPGPLQLGLFGTAPVAVESPREETPKPMRRRNILISGPVNAGKTTLALEYGRYMRELGDGDVLSIDYEGLQSAFHTDEEKLEDPDAGAYYFTRLVAPTLYEIRTIAAQLAAPDTVAAELRVGGKPIDRRLLREPAIAVLKDIRGGRRYGTVVIDTVTRLADDLASSVFEDAKASYKGNLDLFDKMRQTHWGDVRKAMEDLLSQLITSGAHLVLTAWSKGKWNQARRTTTDEQLVDISGVKVQVETYMELILMLVKRKDERGFAVYPSDAILLKSKIKGLPEGAMVEKLDWPTIFAAEPVLALPPDYEARLGPPPGAEPNGVAHEQEGVDEDEDVAELTPEETPFAPGDGD